MLGGGPLGGGWVYAPSPLLRREDTLHAPTGSQLFLQEAWRLFVGNGTNDHDWVLGGFVPPDQSLFAGLVSGQRSQMTDAH